MRLLIPLSVNLVMNTVRMKFVLRLTLAEPIFLLISRGKCVEFRLGREVHLMGLYYMGHVPIDYFTACFGIQFRRDLRLLSFFSH